MYLLLLLLRFQLVMVGHNGAFRSRWLLGGKLQKIEALLPLWHETVGFGIVGTTHIWYFFALFFFPSEFRFLIFRALQGLNGKNGIYSKIGAVFLVLYFLV